MYQIRGNGYVHTTVFESLVVAQAQALYWAKEFECRYDVELASTGTVLYSAMGGEK